MEFQTGELVYWVCLNCGCPNVDIYGETSCPICEVCETETDWFNIVESKAEVVGNVEHETRKLND